MLLHHANFSKRVDSLTLSGRALMSFSLSSNHQYKPWILFLNTFDAPTQGTTSFHPHSLAPPLARGGGGGWGVGRGVLWVLLIQPWQDLSQWGHSHCRFRVKTFSLKCFDLSLTCLSFLKTTTRNFFDHTTGLV